MSKGITQKLEEWLNKTGYPLEMRVAKYLSERNMFLSQASYYIDYETNKNREIDIISRLYDIYESHRELAVAELETYATIECKAHQTDPWVFFKDTKISHWDFESPLRNNDAKLLLRKSEKELKNNLLYKLTKSSSTGVTQAFSKKDTPYTATMGTLKAAEAKIRKALETEKIVHQDEDLDEAKHAICVFPVIITDARLFEVSLSDENTGEFKEVEYTSVAIRYPRKKETYSKGTVIYVFRETAINALADALEDFEKIMKGNLAKILTLEKGNDN